MKRLGVLIACLMWLSCSDDSTRTQPSLARRDAGDDAGAWVADAAARRGTSEAASDASEAGEAASDASATADASAADPFDLGEGDDPVSAPGRYRGYSEPIYPDGHQLSSQYVAMRDGVELAMDLYRPKQADGSVVTEPLPVVWMHTPYNRRYFSATAGAERGLTGETYPGTAARLVQYGYVVAVVDFRGLYASYGTNKAYNRGEWLDAARFDAYDVTEWLAAQPFSTGEIGMWGCSATGGSQLQAATTAPPHLKAIFPMSCEFDAYSFAVPGGMAPPKGTPTRLPTGPSSPAMRDALAEPVDGDADRKKLMEAIAQHASGVDNAGYVPFRDSVAENFPEQWWLKSSPHTYLADIQRSGVALYLAANWDEGATKHGAFFTFNNLTNPAKLIVGPSTHCAWTDVKNTTGFDLVTEELRFFDHWLKGVQNGVMDEPRVFYYTYNAPKGREWAASAQWPLANERRRSYYFAAVHAMTGVPPSSPSGKDEFVVRYDTTPENMLETGLYYETPELSVDVQITGHPAINLWVTSTATDGDFIATLQDLAPDGTAKSYNTHGRLRASNRKIADPPYNNLELPWHPSNEADAMPLVPGEPTEISFELLPISMIVKKGHRIRVVLTFASPATPQLSPAPTVAILRDAMHRSSLSLPIIPATD